MVCHQPESTPHAAVVVFPALAEEMNKSRRLVWALGQQLSAHGIMTVVPDLMGTGDSTGDFVEARWQTWSEDMRATRQWIAAQGIEQQHALLVRLGACLFTEDANSFVADTNTRIAAWQPEYDGATALRQLLRMKVMSDRVTWGEKTKLADLQNTLNREPIEVGGYAFHPKLASAINAATFAWPDRTAAAQASFEWGKAPEETPTTHTRYAMDGQRFWTAVEPEVHDTLVQQTVDFFAGGVA